MVLGKFGEESKTMPGGLGVLVFCFKISVGEVLNFLNE